MAKGIKTGGRQKGTPNKENPLKGYLRAHSLAYFEPKPQTEADGTPRVVKIYDKEGAVISEIRLVDADGNPQIMSDFDVDMIMMETSDRVNAELRLLEFHTPKMKSVDATMSIQAASLTIEETLRNLSQPDTSDS